MPAMHRSQNGGHPQILTTARAGDFAHPGPRAGLHNHNQPGAPSNHEFAPSNNGAGGGPMLAAGTNSPMSRARVPTDKPQTSAHRASATRVSAISLSTSRHRKAKRRVSRPSTGRPGKNPKVITRRPIVNRNRNAITKRGPHRGRVKKRSARVKRGRLRLWPSRTLRRRTWRAVRRAPGLLQLLLAVAVLAALALVINGVHQVLRKPTELFFPVSGALNKLPEETWSRYAPIFRNYSTEVTTAPFLAALAQVEASGNPGGAHVLALGLATAFF